MEYRFKLYDQIDQKIIESGAKMSQQMADTLNREFNEISALAYTGLHSFKAMWRNSLVLVVDYKSVTGTIYS